MKKRKSKKNSKAKNNALKVTINGKEETMYGQEEMKAGEEKTVTFSNWEETKKAEQETAASHEDPKEDDFNWDDEGEKDVFEDDPKVVPPYQKKKAGGHMYSKKKHPSSPVKRAVTTIAVAAVLGTGLGLVALNMSGSKEASAPAAADKGSQGQTVKAGDSASDKQETGDTSNSGQAEGNYKTYAVQAGKFSSEKGAKTLVDQLTEKGYSAVSLSKDDGYTYVIAGLSAEKSLSQQLGQTLIDNDFEAWGGKELSFAVESDMEDSFKQASELSAKAIIGKEVAKADVAKITKAVNSGDAADKKEKEALLQALKELETPSPESGWKAQQELLSVVK
ncbi:SPOR domain-containing protein [Bacillus sp. ISL-51]|uniref:SPOR domain-containing protein n=1 Tax=unclassified Bacillus (in: firmicutes) TaxID=185979 RepID=UPI001BE76FE1|nr:MULTISPECIES: SPOR domain-containing protein [unclassified Bacillus (in: firmicutes)]MBT2574231.1 SPOR domain-containing protein [Bacillus sp. ISL-51]MBT2633050.1 SPOR domain-containing protein [Bacillus sp. ISL-26]